MQIAISTQWLERIGTMSKQIEKEQTTEQEVEKRPKLQSVDNVIPVETCES
jgi:hypothetical protein